MSRKRIEKRLVDVSEQLATLRSEARICVAQLDQVMDEADDARLRALVSESPMDRHGDHDARRAAETLQRHHREVLDRIAGLERRQDELLDDLATLES